MLASLERVLQLSHQLFLTGVEVDGRFHHYPAQQVAGAATAHAGHTLAAQAEQAAGLGFGGNLELHAPAERGYFELTAKGGIGKADGHLAIQITAIALEYFVLAHQDLHVEIAGRAACRAHFPFASQTDAVAVVDASGHFYRQRLDLFHPTLTVTAGAGIGDHRAAPATVRAGLLYLEESL